MENRRGFLQAVTSILATTSLTLNPFKVRGHQAETSSHQPRQYWVNTLTRIADPVLTNLAKRQLKQTMPVEVAPVGTVATQHKYTHLEAIGRLIAGIGPWLELSKGDAKENELRDKYRALAHQAIDAATDPTSPDFLNYTEGRQPVVDAAFLCHGIIRAPNELWKKLDSRIKKNLVAALKSTRVIRTSYNNHLLFSAMVEAALCFMGEDWDPLRVDYALRAHESWYKGDGIYGDGPEFHWDYYNSFVIQPMLIDTIETILNSVPKSDRTRNWEEMRVPILARAKRYAAIQERFIAPDGTFPPIGRSLAYRFGAFQLLAQMALRHQLPEDISPAQVRSALTAVIRRMIEAPGTFDDKGWLRIGFCGHQPAIGEGYISTGSLYLCSVGLLPLGLPPEDPFWQGKDEDWTAKKIWKGVDIKADHALKLA
jgi:hypothetical protein